MRPTCKIVGIGCLGKTKSFQRIWQEVAPVLTGESILDHLDIEKTEDAVRSATFYVDQDETVTVNLRFHKNLKMKRNCRIRKPELSVIHCD